MSVSDQHIRQGAHEPNEHEADIVMTIDAPKDSRPSTPVEEPIRPNIPDASMEPDDHMIPASIVDVDSSESPVRATTHDKQE